MSDKRTVYAEDAIKAVTYGALSSATLFGRSDAGMTALRETVRAIKALPTAQPEIIRCKDCMHRPVVNNNYSNDERGCGFDIEFPDYKCPCQCEDGFYNRLPDDNWFCGNAERRTE